MRANPPSILLVCSLFAARAVVPPVALAQQAVLVTTHAALAASACTQLTASSIDGYRNLIGKALASARADAQANGTSGAYAVAATNSRDLLQRSYDRATQMVDFNNNSGNRNPNVTTYVEAGNFKAYLLTILGWLPTAAHWSTISAAYHKSQLAVDAFNGTIAAMERGSQLMGASGQCFTAYYVP